MGGVYKLILAQALMISKVWLLVYGNFQSFQVLHRLDDVLLNMLGQTLFPVFIYLLVSR